MNNSMQKIALNLLSRSPQFSNNPMAREYMEIIRNNDSAKGKAIAENLCRSYGTTKENALNQAMNFFRF